MESIAPTLLLVASLWLILRGVLRLVREGGQDRTARLSAMHCLAFAALLQISRLYIMYATETPSYPPLDEATIAKVRSMARGGADR